MTEFTQNPSLTSVGPKGKLIAIGGNEDKGTYPNPATKKKYYLNFFELGILKRVVSEMGGNDAIIEVITTASMIPDEVAQMYLSAFGILGCSNIRVMPIKEEQDALEPEYLERIKVCNGVMFSGGDQSRLTSIFGGTEFAHILNERYWKDDFVIAGTSAGAMAMSEVMIKGGSSFDALMKGTVRIGQGLGFIGQVIIDSHFVKRGRFGRLMESVAAHPDCVGIGLGEDTGVLITNGNMIETIGSNLVIIADGHHMGHNNWPDVAKGTPLSLENMLMHVLAKGNRYHIHERKFTPTLPSNGQTVKSKAVAY
jgi:cyanophycinase